MERNELIENIARQRNRFANIFISRAEDILVVYNLNSENQGHKRLLHFNKPEKFTTKKEIGVKYSQWSSTVKELVSSEKGGPGKRIVLADKLIHRLYTMIESANYIENSREIGMQALHIEHVLKQQLIEHPDKKKLMLPFKLIGDFSNKEGKKDSTQIVTDLLKTIRSYCGGDIPIHKWIQKQKMYVGKSKPNENKDVLKVPFPTYNTFEYELKNTEFSRTFKPGKDCFSKDSTGMSNSEIERISNRIKNYLIELYLNGISEEELDYSKNPRRWISTFDKLELETFTVHLPLENGRIMQRKQKIFEQIIPTFTIDKSIAEAHLLPLKQDSFWEDGLGLLKKDELSPNGTSIKTGFSQLEIDTIYLRLLNFKHFEETAERNKSFVEFFREIHQKYIDSNIYQGPLDTASDNRIKKSIKGYYILHGKITEASKKLNPQHMPYFIQYLQNESEELRKVIHDNPSSLWTELKKYLVEEKHEIKNEMVKVKSLPKNKNTNEQLEKHKMIDLQNLAEGFVKILLRESEEGLLLTNDKLNEEKRDKKASGSNLYFI